MSFLVELAQSAYPKNALDGFDATSQFSLGNAQAMMWMSQLAYETAHVKKIDDILATWDMTRLAFPNSVPFTRFSPNACFLAAGGHGATIVSFAGTDPLNIEDWITDFTAIRSVDDVHGGFELAVNAVWPKIEPVITTRRVNEQPLFFTGHSMGGALAIIAAERAREQGVAATAVYTFGGPRTGGREFFSKYTPQLGDPTFRLVHGTDVVATVPPTSDFRHVGRLIQCDTGDRFPAQPEIHSREENLPDFIDGLIQASLDDIRSFFFLRFIRQIGPRPLDLAAILLPEIVRDHVPASYFRALSIPLR